MVSLLGVGEKGTPREGVLRDRHFIAAGDAAKVHGHVCRWAEWHGGAFVVPAVVSAAAVIEGDVKVDKIVALTAVLVDLDSGDTQAKLAWCSERLGRPTMIVRSGGVTATGQEKMHAYWRLSEPSEAVARVAALRKMLAAKVGGDQSFGRATQVIRLPGSVHAKNGNAVRCELIACNDLDYDLDELAETIEAMEPMEGIELSATIGQLPMVTANGMIDFSGFAGVASRVPEAMSTTVAEHGDERTRWGEFNTVAGFNIQQVRLGHVGPEQAYADTWGWMLAKMQPPWPKARFDVEFTALPRLDVKHNGPFPIYAAPVDAERGPITATPAVWCDPASVPPRPWIMGRWLLRNTVCGVIAPGGVGKSSLIASMCLSLASARPFLGKDVFGPQRVWYWNLEDDGDELVRQRLAAAMHHGVNPADCGDRLFVDSGPDGATLCTAIEDRTGFRIVEPVMTAIIAELQARAIDVLVIDPFVSSHAVDENANIKIDAVTKEWARVAKRVGCCIVLVHHTVKARGEKITADSARGASALANTARSMLVLNRMTEDEAASFGLAIGAEAGFFNVGDDKHNRAPAERADWFGIVGVALGNGDSVGVVTPWKPPTVMDGVPPEALGQVQNAVRGKDYRRDPRAKEWVGFAVARILRVDGTDKHVRARCGKLVEVWIKSGALKVESASDSDSHVREYVRVGNPVVSIMAVQE